MDRASIEIVQKSFQIAFRRKSAIAQQFYKHLFDAFPAAKAMFHKDMRVQQEMFCTMLVTIVRLLDQPEELRAVAGKLGQAHARYDVTPEQYALTTDAILAALRDILREDFTFEVEVAWRQAVQILVDEMSNSSRV